MVEEGSRIVRQEIVMRKDIFEAMVVIEARKSHEVMDMVMRPGGCWCPAAVHGHGSAGTQHKA